MWLITYLKGSLLHYYEQAKIDKASCLEGIIDGSQSLQLKCARALEGKRGHGVTKYWPPLQKLLRLHHAGNPLNWEGMSDQDALEEAQSMPFELWPLWPMVCPVDLEKEVEEEVPLQEPVSEVDPEIEEPPNPQHRNAYVSQLPGLTAPGSIGQEKDTED